MSAAPQFRVREGDAISAGDRELLIVTPVPGGDSPVQLLREAIARLKSSNGDLPDPAQVANLLAEAREALDRSNVIARAAAQSEEFLSESEFDKALEAWDEGLLVYPGDPALIAGRHGVEEQQRAFHSATAVRTALDQAKWLLDQDRADLAVHFLEEKAAELPDQQALTDRLEELAALLPQWEQKRYVLATLERVETLAQLQQWQAALTILEEALQLYPASKELAGAAKVVRKEFVDHERQKKLARRLELIGQKIAAQAWRQALALLESTQQEFPAAPELIPLRREVDAGLRRFESEAIATELRQCLADGELEQAEQILSRGLESLGNEPGLEALREELESERKYRQGLREAQVLFGRRQLQAAERALSQLAAQDRPEAHSLLDAVRKARAASDEENFCDRGREKALELIHQGQFAQACDLLRNLLSLFPGSPILERDLRAAESRLSQAPPEVAADAVEEVSEPRILINAAAHRLEPRGGPVRQSAYSRYRRVAIAGTASLVLASGSVVAWKLSGNRALVSKTDAKAATQLPAERSLPATPVAGTQNAIPPAENQQKLPPQPSAQSAAPQPRVAAGASPIAAPTKGKTQPGGPPAASLRPFVPPDAKGTPVQAQNSGLPLPPGAGTIILAETIPGTIPGLVKPIDAPASPQPTQSPAATVPAPAAKTPMPSGGRFEQAQLIERALPDYPPLARQRGVFGTVRMEAVIDEQGAVKNVKIVSGDILLATAAKAAVLKWKYKAANLNGKPIASDVTIQILFGDRK